MDIHPGHFRQSEDKVQKGCFLFATKARNQIKAKFSIRLETLEDNCKVPDPGQNKAVHSTAGMISMAWANHIVALYSSNIGAQRFPIPQEHNRWHKIQLSQCQPARNGWIWTQWYFCAKLFSPQQKRSSFNGLHSEEKLPNLLWLAPNRASPLSNNKRHIRCTFFLQLCCVFFCFDETITELTRWTPSINLKKEI